MKDASDSNYFDWNNSFEVIKKAYDIITLCTYNRTERNR